MTPKSANITKPWIADTDATKKFVSDNYIVEFGTENYGDKREEKIHFAKVCVRGSLSGAVDVHTEIGLLVDD